MKTLALALLTFTAASAQASDFMCFSVNENAPLKVITTSKKIKEDRKGRTTNFTLTLRSSDGHLVQTPRDGWVNELVSKDGATSYEFIFGLTPHRVFQFTVHPCMKAILWDVQAKRNYAYRCQQ